MHRERQLCGNNGLNTALLVPIQKQFGLEGRSLIHNTARYIIIVLHSCRTWILPVLIAAP